MQILNVSLFYSQAYSHIGLHIQVCKIIVIIFFSIYFYHSVFSQIYFKALSSLSKVQEHHLKLRWVGTRILQEKDKIQV